MQYGVAGAVSNSSANLLMLALPAQPSVTPRATDFTVQLQQHGQTGTVTLLAESILAADFLIQVTTQSCVRFGRLFLKCKVLQKFSRPDQCLCRFAMCLTFVGCCLQRATCLLREICRCTTKSCLFVTQVHPCGECVVGKHRVSRYSHQSSHCMQQHTTTRSSDMLPAH